MARHFQVRKRPAFCLSLAGALLLFVSRVAAAQVHAFQELTAEGVPSSEKPSINSAWRKVSGALRGKTQAGSAHEGALRRLEPVRNAAGRLRVTVRLKNGSVLDRAELARHGLEIEHAPVGSSLIQGTVRPADLEHVATLPEIAWVGPVDVPIHRVGSIATEGDVGSGANVVRQQGLDGSGVKIGVISDGIDSLAEAQSSGDLGSVTVPLDSRCRRGSGDEGTALLEIVHDLAPGAQLLFSGPGTSVEMIDAVACLTEAGADIIVDDLGFLLEPYFEDGPVAAAVRASVTSGVSYHSAAGNDAAQHLETGFRPSPTTQLHNFNGTAGGPVDNLDSMVLPSGASVFCALQWADAFGASGNDYDLYLVDDSLTIVDASENVQNGNDDPLEFAGVVNPASIPQAVHVVINRYAGATRRLKMFCFGDAVPEYVTPQGSVFGHAALSEVVSVGAVDQAEPGRDDVEAFSSRGPARILFPAEVIRPKPTLVALDGVSVSNAGGFPLCPPFCRFFGTSAAAPHTAGVAALMLQRTPGLSPAALLAALRGGATDIEGPGEDVDAGAGLLNAIASVAMITPATTSTTSTPTIVTTSSTLPPSTTTSIARTSSTSPFPPTTSSTSEVLGTTTTTLADTSCLHRCADDGDECTIEQCEPGIGCRSTALGGAEGVLCLLERLLRARSCRQDEITPRLTALVGRKALKARAHAARSMGASPGSYIRHVKRTVALLRDLTRKVRIAVAAGRLRGDCETQVTAALSQALSLAETTTF